MTFSISFVVIVQGRLLSIGKDYEEAAMDLGASPWGRSAIALLPLLRRRSSPARSSCSPISMDDFVIGAYLSAGSGTDTVPVKIYSNARAAPTPAINALASLALGLTVVLALVLFAWSLVRRRQGAAGSTVGEMAASRSNRLPRPGRPPRATDRALHVHVADAGDVGARPVDQGRSGGGGQARTG